MAHPADYDGGELVIEQGGERTYKLPAGSAIVYPSTTLHRVERVTRGTRLVGITWIQSMVRSADDREILFDLSPPAAHDGWRNCVQESATRLYSRPASTAR
jgi:PKHD-type hydroxylase